MDLLSGHQPLKIILICFLFIMVNGDYVRLQPITLPTFTIPSNVSTSDLVAANKIKIIGNDIIGNDIIEKKDKDIIRIQSYLPKFNRTYNKRKKIRNPESDANIVNVVQLLQPNIIRTTPLPITITKRSPQINPVRDQTESIISNSLFTTTPPVRKKIGPYLYERPIGEPFEYENIIFPDQAELQTTVKPKYLYEKPAGAQFDIEDRFGKDQTEPLKAPSEIEPVISQKNQTEKPILGDTKPSFVLISGGNGKFDIRTLRVLKPKKRKHRKKGKNRKMDKNILDNEIVNIKVN